MAAFDEARDDLPEWLLASASGRELVGRGRRDDVVAAAALDVEAVAPVLVGAGLRRCHAPIPRPSTLSP